MRFIWEKKDWLAVPPETPEIRRELDGIEAAHRELSGFADREWFDDVQQELFLNEILYSWDIEGVHLYAPRERKELVGTCLGFVRGGPGLTPEDAAGFHDAVFSAGEKGFRKGPVGVGASRDRLVYLAPPAEDVPLLMDELCRQAGGIADAELRAAFIHAALVLVHPFADGNGRTARMASLRAAPGPLADPSRFTFLLRDVYYAELGDASSGGELGGIIAFILRRRNEAYREMLRNLRNFDVWIGIHGEKFTSPADMQMKVSLDFEHEDRYE